jgi:hypothetical protein
LENAGKIRIAAANALLVARNLSHALLFAQAARANFVALGESAINFLPLVDAIIAQIEGEQNLSSSAH